MIPIITQQWTFPTNQRLKGKDGNASATGVAGLRDIMADHFQRVATVLTDYHTVGTLAQRPPPGSFGRHYFASDINVLYEDRGDAWVPVSPVAAPLFVLQKATASFTVPPGSNYFIKSIASTADININLPTATGSGLIVVVQKNDNSGFNINAVPAGTDTIDDQPGATIMTRQYEAINLIDFEATNWIVW